MAEFTPIFEPPMRVPVLEELEAKLIDLSAVQVPNLTNVMAKVRLGDFQEFIRNP
jgi:hypothetical protein